MELKNFERSLYPIFKTVTRLSAMQGREARYLAVFCSFFDLKAKTRFLGKVNIEVHAVYNLYYYFWDHCGGP